MRVVIIMTIVVQITLLSLSQHMAQVKLKTIDMDHAFQEQVMGEEEECTLVRYHRILAATMEQMIQSYCLVVQQVETWC